MAKSNNLLDIESQISKLNVVWESHLNIIKKNQSALTQMQSTYSSIAPSSFNEAVKNAIKNTERLERSQEKIKKSAREMELQSIRESNARNALNKQKEMSIKTNEREIAKLIASENLYNKVQSKLNALSFEYKNLSTQKELGLKLTQKEEQRYSFLQSKIQNYDRTLKAVDATMGKHQRNVGNYAESFNPLSNSINQLTRELPAFTYSMQTGFMAISNNIPMGS